MSSFDHPFDEGSDAFGKGVGQSENPYKTWDERDEAQAWNEGWIYAKENEEPPR